MKFEEKVGKNSVDYIDREYQPQNLRHLHNQPRLPIYVVNSTNALLHG